MKLFHRVLATDDADEEQYDRNDQEYIDEPSDGVRCDQPQNPQHKKDDSDSYKHDW